MKIVEQTLLVMTNVPSAEVAELIARAVVERGLAACVNCLPGVKSVYRWEGRVEQAVETSLLMKTTQDRYADLEAAIKALHPYEVPEIIALPIVQGLPAYLDWINVETKINKE